MTGFIIGVAVGIVGTVTAALMYACCKASGEADRSMEKMIEDEYDS